MIRKIVLFNFMAHANTELRLADGLTVLVGPNNIGKSTVEVALKTLARNTNSNFVMQHEQKESLANEIANFERLIRTYAELTLEQQDLAHPCKLKATDTLNETIASVEKTTEQFTRYRSLLVQRHEVDEKYQSLRETGRDSE